MFQSAFEALFKFTTKHNIFSFRFLPKYFYFLVRISRNNNKYVYCKNFKYLMVHLLSSYYILILTHEPKGVIKTRSTILNLKLSFFHIHHSQKAIVKGSVPKTVSKLANIKICIPIKCTALQTHHYRLLLLVGRLKFIILAHYFINS